MRHLSLMQSSGASSNDVLKTARAHAIAYPSSPILQLARLQLERSDSADFDSTRKAFKSAMRLSTTPELSADEQAAVRSIWSKYLEWEEEQTLGDFHRIDGIYRKALRDTLRQGTIAGLHDTILVKYLALQVSQRKQEILPALQTVAATYRPNHTFFTNAFDLIASQQSVTVHSDLRVVYRLWRAASETSAKKVAATLHWLRWLLLHKQGKEAADAVDVMRREVGQDASASAVLDREWAAALDEAERRNAVTQQPGVTADKDVEMSENGSEAEDSAQSDQEA